ncbi:MAG: NTP transferase domain-containing protein [Candidatus Thorarchaeota archaeon]|nr:NTP transferase domain-containing protein [Candidatus Thorarchaeota archaeon]
MAMKKAAILAAGDSTRMMPLSANVPKHLLPIAGKPLLFHTLEQLEAAGIEESLIVYGYNGEELKRAVESRDWGKMNIQYTFQKERKGTAHAASYASDFGGKEEILLMYGDVMVAPNTFSNLIKFHENGGYEATMSLYEVKDPSAYGVVQIQDGLVNRIIEKPDSDAEGNLANAGIYVVGDSVWDAISKTKESERGEYEITDSIESIAKEERVGGFRLPSWWIDIGKPWDILEANKLVLQSQKRRLDGSIEEGAHIEGEVVVEENAKILSGAYIIGPVYVGAESKIGPNCYIRPHSSLGQDVRIGNAVEIKNSVIMDHTNVGHLSYVGDSVIGHNTNLGAGTITANLRHDDADIKVTVKGERRSSGRRKLGAILADNVKTGIGTCLGPGVVVGPGGRTGMGVIVDKDIEENTLVMAQQQVEQRKMSGNE